MRIRGLPPSPDLLNQFFQCFDTAGRLMSNAGPLDLWTLWTLGPCRASTIPPVPCPVCHADVAVGQKYCGSCGTALDPDLTMSSGVTRMAGTPASVPTQIATPTSGGWLSSSGSIDHGRFGPGAVLDGRYRIIGLLGRGGMGEVYRADDLRLGQPVALKFLPEALSTDAKRLAQLHNEVRTARQVSHPNVCRVYDIGDVQGQLFLSMEYVDGEDLSASLRRVGRFPEDKGLEISRQICAGLAAAHDRGVIHRDLKPANIMLDGSGRVRIMDFGLAAAGEVEDIRVGTPAYMAPEQLEGREVTARSDIFALGLVLYEVFTGRRAFTATTLADLVEAQAAGQITAPTELVRNLDPAIERAIMRCLDREPARRPSSVLAVSASLPGGDPIAAALAAGETPSPEMVAAAGGDQAALTLSAAVIWLAIAVILLALTPAISDRESLLARSPVTKPAPVLSDRAEEIRAALGYHDVIADQAFGFLYDESYLEWGDSHGSGDARWAELAAGRPATVRFWYRTSPRPLSPMNLVGATSLYDPPFGLWTGMTTVQVDSKGRLLVFEAAPPQIDLPKDTVVAPVDWNHVIALAGIDPATLTPQDPNRTPRSFADARQAWRGMLPDAATPVPISIEAASYRGRPVYFEVLGPWTPAGRDTRTSGAPGPNGPIGILVVVLLLLTAGILTRRNLKSGRADLRGAFRLGAVVVAGSMSLWLLLPHVTNLPVERSRLFMAFGSALFLAAAMFIVYLAVEPFVRKNWPTMLMSWTRLLAGRVRDPFVGRDLLIGVAAGLVLTMISWSNQLVPVWLGWPEPVPLMAEPALLSGLRMFGAVVLSSMSMGMQIGLLTVLQYALGRVVVQRLLRRLKLTRLPVDVVTIAIAMILVAGVTLLDAGGDARRVWLGLATTELSVVFGLVLVIRVGLLAAVFTNIVSSLVTRVPFTMDSSRFYAGQGWFVLAALVVLAIVGMRWARQGRLVLTVKQ